MIAMSAGAAFPEATSSRAHRRDSMISIFGCAQLTIAARGVATISADNSPPADQSCGGEQPAHRTGTDSASASSSGCHTGATR